MLARERGADQLFQGANFVEHLIAGGSTQFMLQRFNNLQRRDLGAQGDGHDGREEMQQGVRHLREGIVDLVADARLVVGCQTPMANVSTTPAFAQDQRSVREPKTFATGSFSPKACAPGFRRLRQPVDCRCGHLRQRATGAQRNAHHGQEIGRYAGGQRERA